MKEVKKEARKEMQRVACSQTEAARLAEPTKMPDIVELCHHQQEWFAKSQMRPRAIKPGQEAAKAVTATWLAPKVGGHRPHGATRQGAKGSRKGSTNHKKEKGKAKAVGAAKAHRVVRADVKFVLRRARRASNEPVCTGAMMRMFKAPLFVPVHLFSYKVTLQ